MMATSLNPVALQERLLHTPFAQSRRVFATLAACRPCDLPTLEALAGDGLLRGGWRRTAVALRIDQLRRGATPGQIMHDLASSAITAMDGPRVAIAMACLTPHELPALVAWRRQRQNGDLYVAMANERIRELEREGRA
jgi:hypothetical protein